MFNKTFGQIEDGLGHSFVKQQLHLVQTTGPQRFDLMLFDNINN